MTSERPPQAAIPLWQALAGWLRLVLIRFWQRALPKDAGLLRLLREEADQLLRQRPYDAGSLQQALADQWPPRDRDPLSRLLRDTGLSPTQALLLTLLGETQRSHLIALVVAQLQSPGPGANPSLHLCQSLLAEVTTDTDPDLFTLLNHPLLELGLIQCHGQDAEEPLPLPLQRLSIDPVAWGVLLQQYPHWPQCRRLPGIDRHSAEPGADSLELLPQSLQDQIPQLTALLQDGHAHSLVLRGPPHSGRRLLARALARSLGLGALEIPAARWHGDAPLRLLCRYGGWLPVLAPNPGPGETWPLWPAGAPTLPWHQPQVLLLGNDGAIDADGCLELTMPLPDQGQRRRLWQRQPGCEPWAEACARGAQLSGPVIRQLAAAAGLLAQQQGQPLNLEHITRARGQLGAERLRLLAQSEPRQVDRDAIVLPELVASELERLIQRARQRESLWQGLGRTLRQTANPGVRALFMGESGTGKTLAASYIATRLGAPLYRVDLSAVMNKYVGESEKNLSAVLDMAAAGDVVLLFDEADSLFGKRSEGKETGERFANMLTHFLLTRIETHPGIVILTSNNRERIDPAFTRRLDLIVEFPVPGFEERLRLWRSHLGQRGPGDEVYRLLASYCDFTGGQLRNVVLAAAVHAGAVHTGTDDPARTEPPITAADLLVGLLAEYRKLGRELPGKLSLLHNWRSTAATEEAT
ncbi:MAG: ATP-binding protein [Pseudomonadota bacterium]|nr:ATP-binding protein [Pseudomonadota bacterium]